VRAVGLFGHGLSSLRPRPSRGRSKSGGPGPREAMSDNHTQRTNAGRNGAFLALLMGRDDRLDHPSSARPPASVIIMRANWTLRLPTLMVWQRAVASPSWPRLANISTLNPWASNVAPVQPRSPAAASISSAPPPCSYDNPGLPDFQLGSRG
jgi:hypothetical protein